MGLTIVLSLLFVAALAGGLAYFSDDARTKRALKAAPVQAIGSVHEGMIVRVTGRLRPLAHLLQAPLSGRRCAYYIAIVEESQQSGKSRRWVEIGQASQGVEFLIEDPTGKIQVHAGANCQIVVTRDRNSRSGTFDDPTEAEKKFLDHVCQDATGLLGFNRTLRYNEGVLEPDEEITALGLVRRGIDGGLELARTPEGPVLVSDDPGVVARR